MKIKNTTGAPLLLCVISALLIGLRFVDLSAFYIDENGYLSMIVLQLIIFAIPSVFYARFRGMKYLSHLRLRTVKAVDIPLLIFAFGFMIFGGAILCFLMYRLMPDAFSASSPANYLPEGTSFGKGLYAVISVAVIPAVTEEFLYRGIVLTEYEKNGIPLAVILSSLSFGLIHFDPVRLPIYFFYGIVLSLVLYATRSLLSSMIVHMANNIFVMFFEVYVYRAAVKQGGGLLMFFLISITACIIFALLFFGTAEKTYADLSAKNVRSDYARRKPLERGNYVTDAVLNPMFIILIAISIAGMIICS